MPRCRGIHGITSSGGIAVLVNASGALGTVTSSARFKQDVREMDEASEQLMQLRPVVFQYRDAVAAGEGSDEYGLIAEEVAEVAPELVAYDAEGEPYSVRYHVLPSLLLNEMQKQRAEMGAQAGHIKAQSEQIAAQEQQIAKLFARIAALERGAQATTELEIH